MGCTGRKLAAVPRVSMPQPTRPNEAWAMDFVMDGTAVGRSFRTLNVIDASRGSAW